jgi:DNA-binding response OmpR family regulator
MDNYEYLLLVEDNLEVQGNNKKILERRGYSLQQVMTLRDARALIARQRPRAIVLDIMLPDGSGLDFLRELRETTDIPVLLLTALGTREDILTGLKAGGDDYLPKPYDLEIFLTRVEALLRRASRVPDTLKRGALTLKLTSMIALLRGKDILLTQKEFALLLLFVQHEGQTMSTKYLYEQVWGQKANNDVRAVKYQVSNLREKIAESGYVISAIRGVGYRFEQE